MRQRATVMETDGDAATVLVMRSTMCEGCEKSGGCGGHCAVSGIAGDSRPMTAKAVNVIGARVGDVVEVESDGGVVLGAAALVFLLPIAVCFLFFFIGSRLFGTEAAGIVSAAVGFVLTFVGIGIADRRLAKRTPRIRIVARADGTE